MNPVVANQLFYQVFDGAFIDHFLFKGDARFVCKFGRNFFAEGMDGADGGAMDIAERLLQHRVAWGLQGLLFDFFADAVF